MKSRTHSGSHERLFLPLHLLFLFFLLFLLLLGLLLPSGACSCSAGAGQLGPLPLLRHHATVVLVTGVIPGGLARGEVEVVHVTCDILAAGGTRGWKT